jgi:nucleotide-binding universal stress UspA family protein
MKVLLGVDGTDSSLRALEEVTERAARTGDELTVGIANDPDAGALGTGTDADDDLETRVREIADRVGLEVEVRRLGGDLGSELVQVAQTDDFDRLVVGGGERSPMGKIELSSDTQFVLLNAGTSVTLVR